ncbi:MAG TPA: hypothetical protein VEC99_16730 [Clostridia bacterium]|nr:hypothetical protein [Clostridia bacterium]
MKINGTFSIGLATFLASAWLISNNTQATLITGLYNTGVDNAGNVLPVHSVEQHYAVSGASSVAYVAPPVFHSPGWQAWATAPAGSAWIGPNTSDSTWPADPLGTYYYSLSFTFDLTGADASTARILGSWATDNSGQIWLNGQYTGFNKVDWGFSQLDSFLINSGFVQGINTLEFRVLNSTDTPNPSGLLVAGLHGEYGEPLPALVPEPSTYLTAALLLLPFAVQGGRRLIVRKATT